MKRGFAYFLLFGLMGAAVHVTDIDYFSGLEWVEAEGGQDIRLLAVYPYNLPDDFEIGPYQLLVPKENPTTRHGALLAHVIRREGDVMHWLQEDLIKAGRAMVMPVYETNTDRLALFKDLERTARISGRGLWAENPIICADEAGRAFDTFAIVQGRLFEAANVRGTVYLNFGEDYREDFTVKVSRSAFRSLSEETQNQITSLTEGPNPDLMVEARGWVFYSGGPMIDIAVGAQLDFLKPGDPRRVKNCLKDPLPGGSG